MENRQWLDTHQCGDKFFCLTYIAKDKRDATFKPDYLDGLVMHVEKGKVYLDGEFVNH